MNKEVNIIDMISVVDELNTQMLEQCQGLDETDLLVYSGNGSCQTVNYLGQRIWSSEDDDSEDNECFRDFIIRKVEYINECIESIIFLK